MWSSTVLGYLQLGVSLRQQALDLFGHDTEEALDILCLQPTQFCILQGQHRTRVLGHLQTTDVKCILGKSGYFISNTVVATSTFSLSLGYIYNNDSKPTWNSTIQLIVGNTCQCIHVLTYHAIVWEWHTTLTHRLTKNCKRMNIFITTGIGSIFLNVNPWIAHLLNANGNSCLSFDVQRLNLLDEGFFPLTLWGR